MTWTKRDIEQLAATGKIRGYTLFNKKNAQDPSKNIPAPKPSKYKNKKVVVDGITFDSNKEYRRWLTLMALQKAGIISELKRQVKFELNVNGEKVATYIADHTYIESHRLVVEDVKSPATRKLPTYRLKYKLMLAIYKIKIKEI